MKWNTSAHNMWNNANAIRGADRVQPRFAVKSSAVLSGAVTKAFFYHSDTKHLVLYQSVRMYMCA